MDEIYRHLKNFLTEEEVIRTNLKELVDSFRYPAQLNLRTKAVKKTRQKIFPPDVQQCYGRIGNYSRCSRKAINNSELCRIHLTSLPYGRMDEDVPHMNKRRGRKGHLNKTYTLEDLDQSLYIQAIVVMINGEPYLMDENGILYHFNANNEIVGRQIHGEVFWE